MSNIAFKSATELAGMIRSKQIGSLELTEHYIERIERIDGDVNAVVVRDFDRAREAARRADTELAAGRTDGPLHGLPITIKEAYDAEGLPTTWGIPIFKDNIAQKDSEAVRRFRGAGAVLMGKTNVPINLADFQSYNEIYGTTNNPWDLERTPGGSSGGSSAALAAGMAGLECGSDIGGSIRNPAHYCGLYGHKPTWGIVASQGHALPGMLAPPDIAVCGPLARSAEDLDLALGIVGGPGPLEAPGWRLDLPAPRKRSLSEYRVALWPDHDIAPVATEVADRVQQVGELLAKLGARVSDVARPAIDVPANYELYLTFLNAVMSAGLPPEQLEQLRKRAEAASPDDKSQETVMARAATMSHRAFLGANNHREHLRHVWRAFFDEWDILICPQTATTAFPHDHSDYGKRTLTVDGEDRPFFEQLFWAGIITGAYLPSTVFPTGPSSEGLPIGLQAVGAEFDDRVTIDFARLLEQELGGFVPPPDYAD